MEFTKVINKCVFALLFLYGQVKLYGFKEFILQKRCVRACFQFSENFKQLSTPEKSYVS